MTDVSTIQLRKDVIKTLKKTKEYPRQTYNELLTRMAQVFIKVKKSNQYDEFLHKIQQPKMKELWDNKEDEAWEHV
jgi:rRNA pseudouridine-1189 N-methylase Emg1 (Nep1/Mra1 family)